MYSKEYLRFVGRQHLPIEYHDLVEKLSDIIPSHGQLKYSLDEISGGIGCSNQMADDLLQLLLKVNPTLMVISDDKLLFDYDPKEVESARHFQNALSNLGLSDL